MRDTNCTKNKKININIFVDVNLNPLAYLVQEYLIAHITINLLKHVIVIGGPLLFTFILFGATPLLLLLLLLLPPSFSPFLFFQGKCQWCLCIDILITFVELSLNGFRSLWCWIFILIVDFGRLLNLYLELFAFMSWCASMVEKKVLVSVNFVYTTLEYSVRYSITWQTLNLHKVKCSCGLFCSQKCKVNGNRWYNENVVGLACWLQLAWSWRHELHKRRRWRLQAVKYK